MLQISRIHLPEGLKSEVLSEHAARGHCDRSQEYVALMDGEEAGLLSYEDWSDQSVGFIYEVFVLPGYRRRGVGAHLLLYAESRALQLFCKLLRLKPFALDQEPDETRLVAWYTKMGYSWSPVDHEVMEKCLPET